MNLSQKLNNLCSRSKVKLKRSCPMLLCIAASAGVVATAVFAARATPKALILIEEAEEEHGELSTVEKAFVALPLYLPSIAIGAGTIACIFGANALNQRQQATFISAWKLAEGSFEQYKAKLKELYGEEAHNNIVDEIVKEKAKDANLFSPGFMSSAALGINEEQETLHTFYEVWSGRYFESTMSRVLQAEYHLNRNLTLGACISLNDLYSFFGLSGRSDGELKGWVLNDSYYWIDFNHREVQLDDGMEIIIIEALQEPDYAYLE